ncbi:MAG TPA: hypothetical protein VKQ30_16500, partial [Ktedonobacterales bacterium]|nr:hypothetical protein [Ktedonobacterales bacterium]
TYHSSTPIAVFILICAAMSFVALVLMPERAHRDVSVEHEEAVAAEAAAAIPAGAQPSRA